MAETLHSPEETQKVEKTFDEVADDALELGNSGHDVVDSANDERTVSAARSIVDLDTPETTVDRNQIPRPPERKVTVPQRPVSEETYRRRRRVATATAVGVGVAAGAAVLPAMLSNLEADAAPTPTIQTVDYTVSNGESLWTIADKIEGATEPGSDKRDIIQEIQTNPANIDVLKDGLQGGDTIKIPVSYE